MPGQPPTDFTNRSTVCGSIACGSITAPSSMPPSTSAGSGSITNTRARRLALAVDVHDDQGVVAAHHLVGEVETAGAEVEHAHAGRELALLQPLGHLATEAVVAHEGVADAGHQYLARPVAHRSSTSSGLKKW